MRAMKHQRGMALLLLSPLALAGCSILKAASSSGFLSSSDVASSSAWSEIPSSGEEPFFDALERGLKAVAASEQQGLVLTPRGPTVKILSTDVISSKAIPGFESASSSSSPSEGSVAGAYPYAIEMTADDISAYANDCGSKTGLKTETDFSNAKITLTTDEGSVSPVQNIKSYYYDHAAYLDLSKAEFTESLLEWMVDNNSSDSSWVLPPKSYFDLSPEGSLIDLALPLTDTLPSVVASLRTALQNAYENGTSGTAQAYGGADGAYRLQWAMDSPEQAVAFLEAAASALFTSSLPGQAAANLVDKRIVDFFGCVEAFSLSATSYFSQEAFGDTDLSVSFLFDLAALEARYPDHAVYPTDLTFQGILTPIQDAAAAIPAWPADLNDRSLYQEVDTSVFDFPTLPEYFS
jgi:hypothetical protein